MTDKIVPGLIKRVLAKGNLAKKKAVEKLDGLKLDQDGYKINGKLLLDTKIVDGVKTFYLEDGEEFSYPIEMVYTGLKLKPGITGSEEDFDESLDTEPFQVETKAELEELANSQTLVTYSSKPKPETVSDIEEANLVTSQIEGKPGFHAPVLDFDFPHTYVPSSTPGHGHLYIDVEWDEETYWLFVETLVDFGLIEPGYLGASRARGYTAVRLPWIKKGEGE